VIQAVQQQEHESFIETITTTSSTELSLPYGRLILLRLSSTDEVENTAQQVADMLTPEEWRNVGLRDTRPAPASILRVSNHRWQILLFAGIVPPLPD